MVIALRRDVFEILNQVAVPVPSSIEANSVARVRAGRARVWALSEVRAEAVIAGGVAVFVVVHSDDSAFLPDLIVCGPFTFVTLPSSAVSHERVAPVVLVAESDVAARS